MNIDRSKQRVFSYNKLNKFQLGRIKASGWIKDQLQREMEGMGGNLDSLEPDMIGKPFVQRIQEKGLNTSIRAGWCGEISGTYWTGLIQLAFTLNDENLKRKAENWVNGVLLNQDEDGYIGTYFEEDNRSEDYNPWGTNWALRALLSYYEATDRQDVLEACYKALLWYVNNWVEHRTDYAGPTIIESMVIMYLYKGDIRLLEWAEKYMDWLETESNWPISVSSFLSDKLDFNSEHAVAYGENVKHPALLYCADGRKNYLDASINGLNKVVDKCFQRTGAPVSNFEYLGPVGSTSETEYCNFATYSNTFSSMAMITADPKYGDLMEKIVFNGAEGARKKDERAIGYMTSPNQIFATSNSSTYGQCDMQLYAPVYNVACCPAQSVRVIPEYVSSMCMSDGSENIYLMAYGPCTMDLEIPSSGEKLYIEEITEYPFRNEIILHFKLENPVDFTLNIKIPRWCSNPSITINDGTPEQKILAVGFYPIKRIWNNNDLLTVKFPMEIKVVEVDDSASSNKKPLAIEMGPLLFSLKIPEKWRAIEGYPVTKLPEEWSWYEASPEYKGYNPVGGWDMWKRYENCTWNYALVKSELHNAEVIENMSNNYPWENSPVKIKIAMRKAKYMYPPYPSKTIEIYENPIETLKESEYLELIPYGCTTLRISYFPVAKEI